MALGLPVVSTNVGGLPYLIDDDKDGCLVKPKDVDGMTKKLLYLLEHDVEALKISKAARLKVEGFDWEVIKKEWVKLLN
jgi:glycosyltransferase involved in cell wall biosynthesis